MPSNDRQLSTHIYVGYVLTIFFLCIFWCWYNRKHKLMINIYVVNGKSSLIESEKCLLPLKNKKCLSKCYILNKPSLLYTYIYIYIYTYIHTHTHTHTYIYIYISSNCNYCLSFSLSLSLSTDYYLSRNVFCSPFL